MSQCSPCLSLQDLSALEGEGPMPPMWDSWGGACWRPSGCAGGALHNLFSRSGKRAAEDTGPGGISLVCRGGSSLPLCSSLGWPKQTWGLKQHTFMFSRLGPRSSRSRCGQGCFFLKPLSLACRWLSSPWVLTWPSLWCICVLFSSFKDASQIGSGTTLVTLFYPSHLLKRPCL